MPFSLRACDKPAISTLRMRQLQTYTTVVVFCLLLIGCGSGTTPFTSTQQSTANIGAAAINFGAVAIGGAPSLANDTITNTGGGSLTIMSLVSSGDFSVASSQCIGTLAHGQSCSFSIAFHPAFSGTSIGSVDIATNLGSQSVALSGLGQSPASISFIGTINRFPDTPIGSVSPGQSVTIENSGDLPAALVGISVSGPFAVNSQQCVSPFAGHTKCQALITFVPTQTGMSNGLLLVNTPGIGLSGTLLGSGISRRPTYDATVRFLSQAAYGPTPSLIGQVQAVGFASWLDTAIQTPAYDYTSSTGTHVRQYWGNTQTPSLAVRQRVSSALAQIFVVGNDVYCGPDVCGPLWENLIEQHAFGSFADLLTDVAKSPLMGAFLDNAGNFANSSNVPNQNFARELMQLMTIGTQLLDNNGQPILDPAGNPLPTYTQENVVAMSAALSGWYYPVAHAGYLSPMLFYEAGHDQNAKAILPGITLPAGQGGEKDFADVIAALVSHPNAAPFISRRLIQHLVTSNPSAAYTERIANVFKDDGSGNRGNLSAVVRAILLDPEARAGDDPANQDVASGHFMEPQLYMASIMNVLNGYYQDDQVRDQDTLLAEPLYSYPSVFSYYSPDHRLANGTPAPEVQLLDDVHLMAKVSFTYNLLHGGVPGMWIDWAQTPFWGILSPDDLLDLMDHLLFHGTMSAPLRAGLASFIQQKQPAQLNDLLPDVLFLAFINTSYQVIR